jgi:hypothetical protein
MIVHLLGNFQVSEEHSGKVDALRKGIVAHASDLSATGFATSWRRMLGKVQDLVLLNGLVEKGMAIEEYVDNTGIEEGTVSNSEADALLKENEKLGDKVTKLTLANKALKDAEKKLAWYEKNFSNKEVIGKMTPKQVKENFTVKELRAVAKEMKMKGYTKLNEADLIKELKKSM